MKPLQAFITVLWTILVVSFFVEYSSAAPSSDPAHPNAKSNSSNVTREMRAIRRSKFPLRSDDPRRNSKRTNECRLGKTVHEIGDTWNPSLGEPFGTMYCIECACEQVQKKRKIVARIRCRNIKNLCPKLECNDAISIPTQCCKVCPVIEDLHKNGTSSDSNFDPSFEDSDNKGDSNNREYAALLTPRSSSTIKSSTGLGEPMDSGLAAGRFIFLKKSLYYSFVYNDDMPRAKYVQFVDSQGNVVEEQEVTQNQYQKDTRKICGVWRKIPRVYRKLLKEEKLHAALVTEKVGSQDNDVFLGGRVSKQKYVSTEMYSSLLESREDNGGGGMAVITVSPSTGSIYTNILFNGEFDEDRDIGITVRIADLSANQGVEETVTIGKINYDTNSIEIRSILEAEQLEALSRGRLFIVVYSPNNPEFRLTGLIQARATCDIFDTMLEMETENSQTSKAEGVAWVYPLPDGSWSFNVQLAPEFEAEDFPQVIKLEVEGKILEDNLPFKTIGGNMTRQIVSGMGPRHYQLLYEENIYLVIVTEQGNILRGRLVYRIFGDAQLSDSPLMITSKSQVTPKAATTQTQGLLWIGVDLDCGLNYQLSLSQNQHHRQEKRTTELMRLEIMETLELSLKGFPVRSYVLDNFDTSEFEGIYKDFPKITYAHLKAGDALFKIIRVSDSSLLASTIMKNIHVPNSCLPSTASVIDNLASPDYFLDGSAEDNPSITSLSGKCFYDGKLREEYSQWTPFNDTCSICNCYKGQVKCEAVVCPALKCANPVLVTGECCRSCLRTTGLSKPTNQNEAQGCNVEGDRFHPAGSSWHPYMPPNGFMICTTCSCNEDTLKVECMKEECPALECAPEIAVFPKALSCCKVCPPKKEIDQDTINDAVAEYQGKKGGPSERQVLEQGGCRFRDELHENGEEWSHRVEPFGYIPCMSCTCLNGSTKCGRRKCPAVECEVKVQMPGECCPTCGSLGEKGFLNKRISGGSSSSKLSSSKSNGRYSRKPGSKHRS